MTQQYLVVNGGKLSGNQKKPSMIKTYSFTTDDDDGGSTSNGLSILNHDKLLSMNSHSFDSNNDDDGNLSETSNKLRQRKSKQQTEMEV